MPRLACWSCGRQIYTVSPIESLFADERRCPRCGAFLYPERREVERRAYVRRQAIAGGGSSRDGVDDRRRDDRRQGPRRRTLAA